jgi:hypothetical protein
MHTPPDSRLQRTACRRLLLLDFTSARGAQPLKHRSLGAPKRTAQFAQARDCENCAAQAPVLGYRTFVSWGRIWRINFPLFFLTS